MARVAGLVLVFLVLAAAYAQADTTRTQTMAEVVAGNPELSVFLEFLQRAGLQETLERPGPRTVFAPTNEAFEQLPEAQLAALQSDVDMLRDFLKFHIIRTDIILTPAGMLTANGSLNVIDRVLITPAALEAE